MRATAWLVPLSLAALCAVATANDKVQAEALFRQGKKLMVDKRYADACAAFESSYRLDPAIGTQLNIAKCYEEWGKIGRAYLAYRHAEKLAKDAKDPREPKIRELVEALEPSVPHLTIRVRGEAPDGLRITVDGKPIEVLGEPMVIDPGPHTIEWQVGDGAKRTRIVPIDRGGDSEIMLDLPKGAEERGGGDGDGDVALAAAAGAAPDPGRNQRLGGLALGGAGVVAIGVSSIMTLSARGKYNDALELHCGGMKDGCDATGLALTHDARSTANKATVVFLVGAAMVGGGAALYFLAPKRPPAVEKRARYLAPAVTPDGVVVVVGGTL